MKSKLVVLALGVAAGYLVHVALKELATKVISSTLVLETEEYLDNVERLKHEQEG